MCLYENQDGRTDYIVWKSQAQNSFVCDHVLRRQSCNVLEQYDFNWAVCFLSYSENNLNVLKVYISSLGGKPENKSSYLYLGS